MNMWQSRDHVAGVYVRNPNLWCNDILQGLTGFIVTWSGQTLNNWRGQYVGCAITRRHVAFTGHAHPSAQGTWTPWLAAPEPTILRFVDAAGNVVDRTLIHQERMLYSVTQCNSGAVHPCMPGYKYEYSALCSRDFAIGVLDSDLPESITPFKLLPRVDAGSDYIYYSDPGRVGPGLGIALSQDWWSPTTGVLQAAPLSDYPWEHDRMLYVYPLVSTPGSFFDKFENFRYGVYNGDSGTSCIAVVGGQAALAIIISSNFNVLMPHDVIMCVLNKANANAIAMGRLEPGEADYEPEYLDMSAL